jgi:hypothetical protein
MKKTRPMIMVIGFFLFAQAAQAQWTPAKRITWTSGDSYPEGLVVDPAGYLHLVWEDKTPGQSQIYYKKSTDGGVTWSPTQRLTWASGGSWRSRLAVDSSGSLHLIWIERLGDWPGNEEIFYRKSTDGGATWTPAKRLTWTPGDSDRPDIAACSSGDVHLTWQDYSAGSWEINYKKSTDGGVNWTSSQRLSWTSGGSWNPAIALDSVGNPHVVWDNDAVGKGEIYFKKSSDGGATWTASKRLTWTSGYSAFPNIAIDPSVYLHVVWMDDTPGNYEIYDKRSTNGGAVWMAGQRLTSNSGTSVGQRIVADSSGGLHVVWSDNTPGNEEIYYRMSADGGVTWTTSQRLSLNSGESDSPRIAVDSSGNVHVVWCDDTPGNHEVYYSQGK